MKKEYFFLGFIHAAGVFLYILPVVWLLHDNKDIFEDAPEFFVPVFMLLLFVISASITGLLVLGKPIHMYMNGFKKEAFTLLFSTLAGLIIFLILVMIVLLIL